MTHPFFDLNTHGFLRVAVGAPLVAVADPAGNAAQTIEMAREAVERGASLVLFPELGISAYAIDDLLQQEALLAGVEMALKDILDASRALNLLIVVGAPLRHRERLYNCAVFVLRGQILAVTPKTYLPNYREFYERRHFASGAFIANEEIFVAGRAGAFWLRYSARRARCPEPRAPRRDLRRPLGSHPAVDARRAGGGDRAAQSFRQQCDRRQIGPSPDALRRPFVALPFRLSLFRGGAGGVDDRSRLRRRGVDLRNGRSTRQGPALFQRAATCRDGYRLREARRRAPASGKFRRLRRYRTGRDAIPARRLRA